MFYTPTAIIAVLSFAVSITLDLWLFPTTTTFPDETRFLMSAAHLAVSGEFVASDARAWEMPGMAFFFALFFKMFSHNATTLIAIRIAQASLVATQAVLIGLLTKRLFRDSTAALISVAIAGFYPFYLFYQGLALSETLFDFLLIGGFVLLYRWRDNGARIDFLMALTITCFAAAVMVKATLTVVPPFLVAAAVVGRHSLIYAFKVLGVAAMIYCALISSWWTRNYMVLGGFVPFTTSASANFYLGNSPGNPTGDPEWKPLTNDPLLTIPGELERSKALSAAAVAYILNDPAAFISRMAQKFRRFWNIVPNTETYSSRFYHLVAAISFGPALCLAVICGILTLRRWQDFIPIYLLFGYFTIIHMITIASLRYRLPIEAFIIVLAGWPAALVCHLTARLLRPVSTSTSLVP
jgi:4-amino-4-deoxy-L-arabinose transferase-like glycosyltransferase